MPGARTWGTGYRFGSAMLLAAGLLSASLAPDEALAFATASPAPHAASGAQAVPGGTVASGAARRAVQAPRPRPRIDVNSATREQLKTLAYIEDAEADRIIAARPYLTSAEIVDKARIPTGVYLANRGTMVAVPAAASRPPRQAVPTRARGAPPRAASAAR